MHLEAKRHMSLFIILIELNLLFLLTELLRREIFIQKLVETDQWKLLMIK